MTIPAYTIATTPETAAEQMRKGGIAIIVDIGTLGRLEASLREGIPLSTDLPEFYAGLDPGIREVVRYLNREGFVTTDSGDGLTKPPGPDIVPFPHVAVAVPVASMVAATQQLRMAVIAGEGIGKLPPGWQVELHYDPSTDHVGTLVMVTWPPGA